MSAGQSLLIYVDDHPVAPEFTSTQGPKEASMLLAQSYMPMWALVISLFFLGSLSVAIPRFRRTELVPPEADKKKKKRKGR